MKIILMALMALAFSINASAEIKPKGTFIPTYCGKPERLAGAGMPIVGIRATEVCFGGIHQTTGLNNVVTISSNDARTDVFKVVKSQVAPSTMAGRLSARKLTIEFVGRLGRTGVLMIDPRGAGEQFDALVESNLGSQLPARFTTKTPGNLEVDARNFVLVMTTR